MRPLRQLHIIHTFLALHDTQVILLFVQEHLRQNEELRYQLPDI